MFKWAIEEDTKVYEPYVITFDENDNPVETVFMDRFLCDDDYPVYDVTILKHVCELLGEGNVITAIDEPCIYYTDPAGGKYMDSLWIMHIDENGDECEVMI